MSWSFYTSNGTPTAATGLPGGIRFTYSATTTDANPGSGVIRTDNGTVASTSQVFVNNVDAAGATQTSWYETFDEGIATVRGYLYIQTTSSVLILGVTSVTAASGYYKVGVNYISGARPADGAEVSVAFIPALKVDDWSAAQVINAKTANYTLLTSDAGKVVTMDSSSALTLTVNGDLNLTAGQRVDILQLGTGQVTVSANAATVNATPGLKLRDRYSGASLLCTGNDTYVLAGDLTT